MKKVIPQIGTVLHQHRPGRPKRRGLRGKQIAFLEVLASAPAPIPKEILCELAGAHPANTFASSVGEISEEGRINRERINGYPSLITLGYVCMDRIDVDGKMERVYFITHSGREALRQALVLRDLYQHRLDAKRE